MVTDAAPVYPAVLEEPVPSTSIPHCGSPRRSPNSPKQSRQRARPTTLVHTSHNATEPIYRPRPSHCRPPPRAEPELCPTPRPHRPIRNAKSHARRAFSRSTAGPPARSVFPMANDVLDDACLRPVHPARPVGVGYLCGGVVVPASVARPPVDPVPFQPPPAQPADEQAGQLIPVHPAIGRHRERGDLLHGQEAGVADQRGMGAVVGDHPIRSRIPHPHRPRLDRRSPGTASR
jgi:hypothetical protein